MSALAKPFIHPTLTIGGAGEMINVENVENISSVTSAEANLFTIEFSFGMEKPSVTWKYATDVLRDADLGDIQTLISNAIT